MAPAGRRVGLLVTCLVDLIRPAVAFAAAAVMLRRRGDDLTVAVLEAGAVALGSIFVALEIRHGFQGGGVDRLNRRFRLRQRFRDGLFDGFGGRFRRRRSFGGGSEAAGR